MSHILLLLPLLIPLYGAVLCIFCWTKINWQKGIAILTQGALLVAAFSLLLQVDERGILATQIGNWPAPYGITIVADLFSCLMLLAAAIIGTAVMVYSYYGLDIPRKTYGYYPLLLLLQMGVSGACLTGDLFNLFVWFEVLLVTCFVLIALGGTKAQLEGSIKYVTINLLASGFLLIGISTIYGITGTLNMAELAMLARVPNAQTSLITIAGMFFLIAFGIKAAIFPLFFWLPASYHTPPIAISAFIAGLITKVGMYALIRLYTLIFAIDLEFTLPLFLVISILTMVIGVIGAAAQTDFRKILSFHIVSQIGYMVMGIAIFTPLAFAGSIFFILHNILVKTNFFLISGIIAKEQHTFSLKELGGVYLKRPVLSLFFVIAAFSLAGIPPLSGFWGKFVFAKAGIEAGNYVLVAASLGVSLITIFSMTKIWNAVFWKPKPEADGHLPEVTPLPTRTRRMLYAPVLFLTLCILFIGLYAEPLLAISVQAAEQLLNTDLYINAVLVKQ